VEARCAAVVAAAAAAGPPVVGRSDVALAAEVAAATGAW